MVNPITRIINTSVKALQPAWQKAGINLPKSIKSVAHSAVAASPKTATEALKKASEKTAEKVPSQLAILLNNCKETFKEYSYAHIYNLPNIRFNLLAASGFVLVSLRSIVANRTASQARGTPQEFYRYQEAVKTTFREFLAFFLSYVLLLWMQRASIDFFRSMLWVKKGQFRSPTFLNPLFQRLFKVPETIRKESGKMGGLSTPQAVRALYGHVKNYFLNKQVPSAKSYQIIRDVISNVVFPQAVDIEMDLVNRRPQLESLKQPIRLLCWLAGKNPEKMSLSETLRHCFEWGPPIFASIPTLILSGFYNESLTQRYAEPLARALSKFRKKEPEPTAYYYTPTFIKQPATSKLIPLKPANPYGQTVMAYSPLPKPQAFTP